MRTRTFKLLSVLFIALWTSCQSDTVVAGPIDEEAETWLRNFVPDKERPEYIAASKKVQTFSLTATDVAEIRIAVRNETTSAYIVYLPLKKPSHGIERLIWSSSQLDNVLAFVDLVQRDLIRAVVVQTHEVVSKEKGSPGTLVPCTDCRIREWMLRVRENNEQKTEPKGGPP